MILARWRRTRGPSRSYNGRYVLTVHLHYYHFAGLAPIYISNYLHLPERVVLLPVSHVIVN